jgi:hypothetical protein
MAKVTENGLSIRAYAKTVPCSHVAVKNAIDEGRITTAAWDGSKIFNKEAADKEFKELYLLRKKKTEVRTCGKCGCSEEKPCDDNGKPCHWVGEHLCSACLVHVDEIPKKESERIKDESLKAALAKTTGADGPELPFKDNGVRWNGGEIPKNIDYKEALRIEQILRAQERQLKNDELIGLLVRKREVDKQLQTAGIEIRKMIERLPMICVDDVLAAKGRTEAITVMEDKVRTLLSGLGDVIVRIISTPDIVRDAGEQQS